MADSIDATTLANQAEAWRRICLTLDQLKPGWIYTGGTGLEAACLTIQELAAAGARNLAERLPLPEGYAIQEVIPGVWDFGTADFVSGMENTWDHPALAACAAWEHYVKGGRHDQAG